MTTNPRRLAPPGPAPSRRAGAGRPAVPIVKPLGDAEIEELQALLDAVPAPLEPLDVVMLDGFVCGVLVQPVKVATAQWFHHVIDVDGRAPPAGFKAARIEALVKRRYTELESAIEQRQWFDPWVFALADGEPVLEADDDAFEAIEAVYPWVAGFATALELFPALLRLSDAKLDEPLALVYRHLAVDDLDDAEALLAEIETLEPLRNLTEAVEGLVRATLLLADIARPVRRGSALR